MERKEKMKNTLLSVIFVIWLVYFGYWLAGKMAITPPDNISPNWKLKEKTREGNRTHIILQRGKEEFAFDSLTDQEL